MPRNRAAGAPRDTAPGRGTNGPRIPVLIAEDHRILRDALRFMLGAQRDISVVGAVGDGAEAVKEAERLSPRVVLMGILLPGLDGIESTRLIAQRCPATGVAILSPHHSPVVVRRAFDAGALGYLTMDCPVQELVRAVRSVSAGKRYLGAGVAERFLEIHREGARPERAVENLTSAERNILRLVVDGRTNPEIANTIGLSRRTVETYRIRLMRKLGIDSVAALVKYAIRHGLAALD